MNSEPLDRKTSVALFLAAFGVYGLLGRGELSSVDEAFIVRTTESLVLRGSWTIAELSNRTLSRYSPLYSLWDVPFWCLGRVFAAHSSSKVQWDLFVTQLGSCATTALVVWLLARWLAELGHRRGVVVATAFLYAFGTLALPYSSTLFPQVAATLLVAWCCREMARGRWRTAAWALALCVWSRHDLVLLWPALALVIWQQAGRQRLQAFVTTGVGATAGLALSLAGNWLRGDPLLAGAYAGEAFTTGLWVGLGGLLFSFGKGLAWHAPLACLGLLGAGFYAWHRPRTGRLIVYVIGTLLVVSAKWWAWHGAMSWGPRLLLPILPLCMLPVAAWLESWERQPAVARRAFVLIAAAAVLANLWAATQPQSGYLGETHLIAKESETIYMPHISPFGIDPLAPVPILWRARGTPLAWFWTAVLGMLALGGLAGTLGMPSFAPRMRPWFDPRLAAAAGLVVLGNVPRLADTWYRWHTDSDAWQYHQLERLPDGTGYRGMLVVPLRGNYAFYSDPRRPISLQVQGTEFFPDSPFAYPEFAAGEFSVVIRGRNGPPGVLRWSIPGEGIYKQPVPPDYLMSPTPTIWQRLRVHWRHFAWLAWIPAFLLLAGWMLAPERDGAAKS